MRVHVRACVRACARVCAHTHILVYCSVDKREEMREVLRVEGGGERGERGRGREGGVKIGEAVEA